MVKFRAWWDGFKEWDFFYIKFFLVKIFDYFGRREYKG